MFLFFVTLVAAAHWKLEMCARLHLIESTLMSPQKLGDCLAIDCDQSLLHVLLPNKTWF